MKSTINAFGDSPTITVPVGQSLTVGSCGAGNATIYQQAGQQWRTVQNLRDGEVTIGPFAAIQYFKVSAGGNPVDWEVAALISAEPCASVPSALADHAAAHAAMGVSGTIGDLSAPLYVEMFAGFGRAGYGTPSGLASYPDAYLPSGGGEMVWRVTGKEGDVTLALNTGTVADGAGTWAGVIQHNDGSYGTYTITGATGSTMACTPALAKSVTNGRLVNMFDAAIGQHMSAYGFYALADYLDDFQALNAYRSTFADQYLAASAVQERWLSYDGDASFITSRVTFGQTGNIAVTSMRANTSQYASRTTRFTSCAGNTNKGLRRKTTGLTGKAGYLETFIGVDDPSVPARVIVLAGGGTITGATKANPCVLTVPNHGLQSGQSFTIASVGGMTQLNGNTYTAGTTTADTITLNGPGTVIDSSAYGTYTSGGTVTPTSPYWQKDIFGLERVCVPFSGVSQMELVVMCTALQTGTTRIGDVTYYTIPSTTNQHNRLFPDNSTVVFLGDSWVGWKASAFIRRLQAITASRGVKIHAVCSPGTSAGFSGTAAWANASATGLTAALAKSPDIILCNFSINDLNADGSASGQTNWIAAMNTLSASILAAGVQPIMLMGSPTASQSQAQNLAAWGSSLALGVPG